MARCSIRVISLLTSKLKLETSTSTLPAGCLPCTFFSVTFVTCDSVRADEGRNSVRAIVRYVLNRWDLKCMFGLHIWWIILGFWEICLPINLLRFHPVIIEETLIIYLPSLCFTLFIAVFLDLAFRLLLFSLHFLPSLAALGSDIWLSLSLVSCSKHSYFEFCVCVFSKFILPYSSSLHHNIQNLSLLWFPSLNPRTVNTTPWIRLLV